MTTSVSNASERLAFLKQQRDSLLTQKKENQQKIRKYEEENKLLFFNHPGKGYLGRYGKWESNPLQLEAFTAWTNPKIKVITITGGNRISKTFTTFVYLLSAIMGRFPWDPIERGRYLWHLMGWKPPIKIRWVGQDWEKHIRTVLEPKFDELWPQSRTLEVKKNNVGIRAYWKDVETKSTIEIMSNNQEDKLFEGWDGHIVAYDEPVRREVRTACARGLVDHNGREIFSMTLLTEPWIEQEVIDRTLPDGTSDPSIYSIEGKMDLNIGFGTSQEGVDNFLSKLDAEQIDARYHGISSSKKGKVLEIDKKMHYIPRFEVPSHWPVDLAIDIHSKKPQHVLFIATDERGFKYVCHEIVGHGDGRWIADEIIKKIARYSLRVNRVIIDPLAKGDSNNENSVYEKVEIGIGRFGYTLETASKDKDDGIIELNSLLMTLNKIPSLFFFRDLPVCTRQIYAWMYDKKGKPSKEDDDQCENLYRLALLNTSFTEPKEEYEEHEHSASRDTKNPVTGY